MLFTTAPVLELVVKVLLGILDLGGAHASAKAMRDRSSVNKSRCRGWAEGGRGGGCA